MTLDDADRLHEGSEIAIRDADGNATPGMVTAVGRRAIIIVWTSEAYAADDVIHKHSPLWAYITVKGTQ